MKSLPRWSTIVENDANKMMLHVNGAGLTETSEGTWPAHQESFEEIPYEVPLFHRKQKNILMVTKVLKILETSQEWPQDYALRILGGGDPSRETVRVRRHKMEPDTEIAKTDTEPNWRPETDMDTHTEKCHNPDLVIGSQYRMYCISDPPYDQAVKIKCSKK